MIKLMVGIPAYGGKVVSQHAGMWFSLGQEAAERDFTITALMTVDANGIDRVRNRLVAEAMAAGNDWLLMVDADTWVTGSNPGASIIDMLTFGLQRSTVVAAPVVRRGADGLNAYRFIDGIHQSIAFDKFHSTERFVEVDAVGAAVMGINLHKLGNVEFEFTPKRSEDLEFCYRLRQMNHHICVDTYVHTCHLGNAPILEYR